MTFYGGPNQKLKSALESFIERACDPSRYEPDLGLNLEICDAIKEKQKNTPREAAIYIVRLINNKNMHVGMLALALLDTCVKNCGYPFHLQIATKEFLNALVRRFPERPLATPTAVQGKILEMIQEWYQTLCKTSRYKEDLVHIRDMHRLLSFKGYRFPPVKSANAAVLNPAASLKSPSELEEEDRIAQAAKLQELIRRGRPEDVQAANELVKKMTGYEQTEKPDYQEQALKELDKIYQKAVLLTEMLNEVKPGEIIGRGDIFQDVYTTCKAAQPKIQKFIKESEEFDDIDKLLELNEIVNNVIEQYGQVKSGNLVKVALPESGEEGGREKANRTEAVKSGSTQSASSLIDLGGMDGPSTPSSSNGNGSLMDDLMNLNFNDSPTAPSAWGAAGNISLASPSNSFPATPTNGGPVPYNVFSSPVTSVNPISVGSSKSSAPQTSHDDFDDFDFVSNTGAPPASGPTTVELLNKNGLQIELEMDYVQEDGASSGQDVLKIQTYFSNSLNSGLTGLTFKVAVPKTLQLRMDPQSAQVVAPFSKRTVTQTMKIRRSPGSSSAAAGGPQEQAVRIRYHVSYAVVGRTIEEQGEFQQFPRALR